MSNVKKDRILRKCETLMVQGFESASEISARLDISYNTARSYIEVVKERWTDSKSIKELQLERERLVKKTEEIVKEAWKLKKRAKNTMEAVGALRTALMGIERLQRLQGIDSLPVKIEKHREEQVFEFAQEINTLPVKARDKVLSAVREAVAIKS